MPTSNATKELRKPHETQNLQSRSLKGLKIEKLLAIKKQDRPIQLLEIGTGSGGISHYFGTHPDIEIEVESVDVVDVRAINDGYKFQIVSDTQLPFTDKLFDIVITNHVIEHVGERHKQKEHLQEIHRVLKDTGVVYLAVPNRWMLVEPHYKIAFLSWLPKKLRTPYLKFRKKGDFYDCEPLTVNELTSLFKESGLTGENLCPQATVKTLEIEKPQALITTILRKTPLFMISMLNRINPTLIYKLQKKPKKH